MARRMCFTNAAKTVLGMTAFDPEGCRYAEGFAVAASGLWVHHAWVLNAFGLVIERTWREAGSRYVGVTFEGDLPRPAGCCQLADFPFDHAWAPYLADQTEAADQLFGAR
jgi:hypothetical protein